MSAGGYQGRAKSPKDDAVTARDDLAADVMAATYRLPSARPPTFGEIADHLLAAGWSRPRVVTTAAELDALPPGSLGYAGHHPRLLVRRLIHYHGWLLGHEHTVLVTSQELLDRMGDVTVVWSPLVESGETQGGAAS